MSLHRNMPLLYRAWTELRYRCNGKNGPHYHNYGGRGITFCQRWNSYAAFAADMGPHPGKGWTLDRKRVNGHYCKANCRWATRKTQVRNRRYGPRSGKLTAGNAAQIRLRYANGGRSQKYIATLYGIDPSMVCKIVNQRSWL